MTEPLADALQAPATAPEEALHASGETLAALPPGALCRILAVAADDAVGLRLLDLGFTPGTEVKVLRRAPLGDPQVYELRSSQLCLRASEARRIRVQRLR